MKMTSLLLEFSTNSVKQVECKVCLSPIPAVLAQVFSSEIKV